MERSPAYLKQNKYKLPKDMSEPRWKFVFGMPEYNGDFGDMITEVGMQATFDSVLSGMTEEQRS